MSSKFWRITGVLGIGILSLVFVVSYSQAIKPPSGAYWNLDAGFGDSEVVLLDDGRYTNGAIGAVSVEGNYKLTGDRIIFVEFGPADAPCLHIPGTYKWSVKQKILTLQAMDDKCPTRQFDWASGLWIKGS